MFSDTDNATPNILIIDDDLDLLANLKSGLANRNFSVDTAPNAESALSLLSQRRYRLSLCDVGLPDMSGKDLLERMRQKDVDLQVLMMTGDSDVGTAVECMKIGAIDYLQKPFSFIHLISIIEKAIEKKELEHIVAVYQASQTIFRSSSLDVLFPAIIGLCRRTMRVEDLCIMLDTRERGWHVADFAGDQSRLSSTYPVQHIQKVYSSNNAEMQPILLQNRDQIREFFGDSFTDETTHHSCIIHPLILDEKVLGVITAYRDSGTDPLTSTDVRYLSILSSSIAQAVGNANLYQELKKKVNELESAKRQLEDAQQQVIHSEKMAAIGQMAAGVAHELNNPLSGILGFSQLLLAGEAVSAQQREDLETIESQAKRCKTIIRNLLELSRTQKPSLEYVDLIPYMRSTLHLITYDFVTSGITLDVQLPDRLPHIYGDPHQLQQVFLNLISNARHALEGCRPAKLTVSTEESENMLRIHFRDNGTGIPDEIIKKVFDPFFTTKPSGKGTGLGLSICRSIIEQHGGELSVQSQPKKGSCFTIGLPLQPSPQIQGATA